MPQQEPLEAQGRGIMSLLHWRPEQIATSAYKLGAGKASFSGLMAELRPESLSFLFCPECSCIGKNLLHPFGTFWCICRSSLFLCPEPVSHTTFFCQSHLAMFEMVGFLLVFFPSKRRHRAWLDWGAWCQRAECTLGRGS